MLHTIPHVVRPIDVWPGKPTPYPKRSKFSATEADTRALLARELSHVGAKNVVIQAFVEEHQIRNDGMLRSGVFPRRPGVIISFDRGKERFSYPCDTFSKFDDNLRAIALTLEHLRAVDRYGVSQHGQQYAGWKALPAPSSGPADDIRDREGALQFIKNVLGATSISGDAASFVRMAEAKTHPDKGGNADDFKRVQKCRELLLG